VRCLSFRFQAFGRPVKNSKKFEEGIFSDLRNLKAGTDASLEEPKSPFLDFLYKNNCIRTQKKQKVFYWYSVPHDRLFLDALERDLKREKMGQEATTVAVSEPALSFEFDSSQSLFEQLTKAQQANTSSFAANAATTYSQSASPILRAVDPMPPPPPAAIPQVMAAVPEDMQYGQVQMPSQSLAKREPEFGHVQYDRNGVPIGRVQQARHTSMPAYMEYSPAPSFVSSHYDDYSDRGIAHEPVTPPQHAHAVSAEPTYIGNDDAAIYTSIPEHSIGYPAMPSAAQAMGNGHYSGGRGYQPASVYSVIEGSPTYKQRRRRSSIPPSIQAAVAGNTTSNPSPHAPYRPSDLRRSVSASVGPIPENEEQQQQHSRTSTPAVPASYAGIVAQHKELLELSRHGTPLPTMEGSPGPPNMTLPHSAQREEFPAYQNDDLAPNSLNTSPTSRAGPIRRARSATMGDLGPYPMKSHSCPIPTCGRLFKRLEHLKRYV
jgi:transcription factor STE12